LSPLVLEEFQDPEARSAFPSISILNDDNLLRRVFGFFVELLGIKGGRGYSSKAKILYRCYFDVSLFPEKNPEVWITNIPDNQIHHVNIFHDSPCPRLGQSFPKICTGTLDGVINRREERNLYGIIMSIKQILNDQNFSSPART